MSSSDDEKRRPDSTGIQTEEDDDDENNTVLDLGGHHEHLSMQGTGAGAGANTGTSNVTNNPQENPTVHSTPLQQIQAAFGRLTADLDATIAEAEIAQRDLDDRQARIRGVTDATSQTFKVVCGGQPFEFARDTVRRYASPGALLLDLVNGNFASQQATPGATPFIDREPDLFKYVLAWHRNKQALPTLQFMTQDCLANLQAEAMYFREPRMANTLRMEMERRNYVSRTAVDPMIKLEAQGR